MRPTVLVFITALAWSSLAHAEPTHPPSPKRALPSYDGRARSGTSAGEVALWPLRILLSPLYFTSEFILRRPLGALTVAAERADIPNKAYEFFAFGPDHKLGFVPVGFVEFGFIPSVGIYGFWKDSFFIKRSDLKMHVEMWPDEWFATSISERFQFGRSALQLHVTNVTRPDNVFYGTGPSTSEAMQSRYTTHRFDASAMLSMRYWRGSKIETSIGLRKVDLSPGHYQEDPSLEQEAATGAFAIPFGFERGYLAPYSRFYASLDTRAPNATIGSGIRVEGHTEQGVDVEHAPASGWIRYGSNVTAFVDLDDYGRVLALTVATLFADPLGPNPVPFTELVSLGGPKWMPGFNPGRLIDRSAAVASLQYSWPIAPWLSGTLEAAVGNVFGEHLQGFNADLLRLSCAFGLRTASNPPLEFLIGFGTAPFAQNATVDSVRVSLGVPVSF